MFEIDISDLLTSYEGDSREFELEEFVSVDDIPQIVFESDLYLVIRIIRTKKWVDVVFDRLECVVSIPEDDIQKQEVYLYDITRSFHLYPEDTDTDDIEYIFSDRTIDLENIITQEILIETTR